jgi:hypothetical protein
MAHLRFHAYTSLGVFETGSSPITPSAFVDLFSDIAKRFKDLQTWRTTSHKPPAFQRCDLALTERVKLLAEWQATSSNTIFGASLRDLVFNPAEKFSPWLDGSELPDLIAAFRNGRWVNLPEGKEISDKLENYLIEILQGSPPSDDLDKIREAIEDMEADDVSEKVVDAFVDAITNEIEQTSVYVEEFDAETELQDHAERLQNLATWACIDASSAIRSVNARLKKLRDEDIETEKVSFPTGEEHESDNFDDESLKHLFEGLLQGQ